MRSTRRSFPSSSWASSVRSLPHRAGRRHAVDPELTGGVAVRLPGDERIAQQLREKVGLPPMTG